MTKILIAGDYVPRFRITEKLNNEDYSFFDEVKTLTNQADYSIVNLECPLVLHEAHPIEKSGPNLKCETVHVMDSLKYAGFDCVTLANNHFRDFGDVGVADTLDACQKYGIDYVGGGTDVNEAERILYKEIDGKRFAFINCCEHEFSIATKEQSGSNPMNPIKQYYAIKEARKKADYVLVVVHGGIEMYQYPTPRMQETYRFFVDAGADAVINHHQHCYSGFEIYNGKPIFYGLGNFCFDENNGGKSIWNYGFMTVIDFDENIGFYIFPYEQCGEKPTVTLLESTAFDEVLKSINQSIADKDDIYKRWKIFANKGNAAYLNALEPFQGRIVTALRSRRFFPSFVLKKNLFRIKSNIQCESHRERLMNAINEKLEK